MRGARFWLAVSAALALSGCVHERSAQQQTVRVASPASPSRDLYSSSPAYAQQAYEQRYEVVEPPPRPRPAGRGLFNAKPAAPIYAAQPAPPSNPPPPPAVGGPYVAAPIYAAVPAAVVMPVANELPYTLDSGDKLRVVVFGQDGISNSYVVDAGGKVNLPLVGAVNARGLTNQQLAAAITAQLKQGFVRDPHVSVEVETYRPFFILGEVTTPGQYPYVANMTAETAVAIAGGFAPRAYKKTVELTRKSGGQQVRTEVPLDFPVRPGDTVLVKERWF